ncbi:hypothetical protein OJ997_01430 [Solirubrobacter phytolaccae]|uniref:Uncharacterized protein n=1 Tax=Solirubrobacter phytolaccae TaxID=1404360 RepID=A0A9X3S6C5_9ACTN|nr:hypothetical protein [Solirubrobacter phytolaccae]MDA0178938.1 hypothetical protein [Solirubrobacter phytolaccae]
MISVYTPNFILGLVSGIMAVTFIGLGIVFSFTFGTLGIALLAFGVLDAIVALVVFSRARATGAREAVARISHTTARVVEAAHSWGTNIGNRHPVKLTVDLAGGRHTRTLLVPSHIDWKAGEPVDVKFAPDDPANFLPVA